LYFGKVFISGGAVLCFSAFCLLASGEFLFITLISVLVHEVGHYIALRLLGGKITEVRLEATGAAIIYDGSLMSYMAELLTALSGPIFSFILPYICALTGKRLGEFWFTLSGVSLVLCAFNLLPAVTLDGGRILYTLLAHLSNADSAEKICFAISCLVSFGVTLIGLWLLLRTGWNFTLLVSGIWLFLGTAIVKRRVWV
jgi:stage IV sporulation protein FB